MPTLLHVQLQVVPLAAQLMVIRVEPAGTGWRKIPVDVQRIGEGVFTFDLCVDMNHFILASCPGFTAQLRHCLPTANEALPPILITLPPLAPDAEPTAQLTRIVLAPLTFTGDKLSPALQERIRHTVATELTAYLDKHVEGCLLLDDSDPTVQAFRQAQNLIRNRQVKRDMTMVQESLNALLNGPNVQIFIQCRKHRSKLKLTAMLCPAFTEQGFGLIMRSHLAQSFSDQAKKPAPPDATDLLNDSVIIEETRDFAQKEFAPSEPPTRLRAFARQIALRLHTLYPNLIFPPEYPRNYDLCYLRIGARQGESYPIGAESTPGVVQQALDELPVANLGALQTLANQITDEESAQEKTPPLLRKLGDALYKWLGTKVDTTLRTQWDQAQAAQPRHGLRLRLCCDAPEVLNLPWEYLRVPWLDQPHDNDGCVARCTNVVFSRYLAQAGEWQPLAPVDTISSLLLVPTPPDAGLTMPIPQRELKAIRFGVIDAAKQPHGAECLGIDLALLPYDKRLATWDEAKRHLLDNNLPLKPHIFHFIGHGQEETQLVKLVGETQSPTGALTVARKSSKEIRELLQNADSLRLLLLQSCKSAEGNKDGSLLGMGAELAQFYAAVVAMQHVISEYPARRFAYGFYMGLALGHDVDIAAAEGRQRIAEKHKSSRAWGTPVVYGRTMQLFPYRKPDSSNPNRRQL